MTETDATRRPLGMPERFIPYLEKYRLYLLFKDMAKELVVSLPKDHLRHIKVFLSHNLHTSKDVDKVILLISPELQIDVQKLARDLIKGLGVFVITRRCVMDRYEKHDDYEPGCVSPVLMSEVTRGLAGKEPVRAAGWLMFDHPCTVREARCLQQDGVLPTVTLVLTPPPAPAPAGHNSRTPARSFFQQDFEGLKFAYKATLKEVYIHAEDSLEKMSSKCFNAVRASAAGAQGAGQGHHALGAPGVYRVLVIGPRGSGRRTQARTLARHFGLVYLNFDDLCAEAMERSDEIGDKLRKFGTSVQLKADIVRRRLLMKDCIDHGWALNGYPMTGVDFEHLDNMPTPPNRVIFLNTEWKTCKERAMSVAVDWCTGKRVPPGGPRARRPRPAADVESEIDNELELYFTEALAELRAGAGITAVEISANESAEEVQTKMQAAVMAAPSFNLESGSQLRADFVRVD